MGLLDQNPEHDRRACSNSDPVAPNPILKPYHKRRGAALGPAYWIRTQTKSPKTGFFGSSEPKTGLKSIEIQ